MSKTIILEEHEDIFEESTGLIQKSSQRIIRKARTEETDEFIKVSRYINTIFAYQGIPLSLVPISLIFAQRMEFKTNKIYLFKADKEEIAEMLGVSLSAINNLILECKKYDIIRSRSRGVYEVNSFLYSTGNLAETRALQARMDFEANTLTTSGITTNLITGDAVKKSVTDAQLRRKKLEIPGQMTLEDFGTQIEEKE